MDCGDPGNPYGGYRDISGGTTFRSTVTYTCKPNHHLEGDDSQTCQGNGQWSGFKPVCLGINSIFCFVQNSSFATYPVRSAFRARMIVWLGSDRLCIIQFAELVGWKFGFSVAVLVVSIRLWSNAKIFIVYTRSELNCFIFFHWITLPKPITNELDPSTLFCKMNICHIWTKIKYHYLIGVICSPQSVLAVIQVSLRMAIRIQPPTNMVTQSNLSAIAATRCKDLRFARARLTDCGLERSQHVKVSPLIQLPLTRGSHSKRQLLNVTIMWSRVQVPFWSAAGFVPGSHWFTSSAMLV